MMTETLAKIEKLKKAIAVTTDPDIKATFVQKLNLLESQIAKEEAAVDKKEEKASAEEKKTLTEAEEKIQKLEKAIAVTTDPDIKATFQAKLNKLKGDLKDVKQEIKEEKKEIAEQKQVIKDAVKEVKDAIKDVKPKAGRRKKAIKIEPKAIEKKKKERKKVLSSVIDELDAMIERNKRLKSKYGSDYKKTGKPTDLERDSKRKAKPFGYRFKGKYDYRVPTEAQIRRGLKRGTIDYEARPNRADVSVKRKVKLEDGGMAGNIPEWLVMIKSEEGKTHDWQGFAKSEDEALYKAEQEAGFESVESGITMITDKNGKALEYKRGGNVKRKKVGTSKEDKARFAKPAGWRWKEEAVAKRIIERKQLSMQPSKKMREKYPDLVYFEDRLNKADKKPTRTSAPSI